jgi:large subunit ribosomal protein L37e
LEANVTRQVKDMAGKGSPSMGKRQKKTHILCRRCGKRARHIRTGICSACGFGRSRRVRRFSWQSKAGLGKARK